ncbi:hypothetical protein [uncultured Clostridium sp.]|uniref:hypothetical protein n=1 Tax=uncultured Clostridium sp. TaxID=59620 RepID=UPI0028EE4A17|nr:hypothetical protein [uncultured Clostridium sp.]
MQEPKIKGGYILLSRRLIESEIFEKPPLYLKVWVYLLSRAQHKEFKDLKAGELWTKIPEIQEACSWYVGYRKVTPTYKEVYAVIDWLRSPHERICERTTNGNTKGNMIGTTKGTQGMLVNIENYGFYQDPKNYESNSEGNTERTTKEPRTEFEGNNINKNDKECNKNEQECNIYDPTNEALELCKYYSSLKPSSTITQHLPTLKIWINDYGFNWTKEAMEKCLKNKNRFIQPYIETLLKNWQRDGKEEHSGHSRANNSKDEGKYTGFKPAPPKVADDIDTTGLI